jgi:hypothetical protein
VEVGGGMKQLLSGGLLGYNVSDFLYPSVFSKFSLMGTFSLYNEKYSILEIGCILLGGS